MPYISNSELESRLKKRRQAREKLFEDSLAANTEMAGWQDEAAAPPEKEPDKRGVFDKVRDFGKKAGSEIAKPYKQLSSGLAEVVADVTGTTDRENDILFEEQDNATAGMQSAREKLKDPNLDPKARERWQRVLDMNQDRFNDATNRLRERTQEITEKTDPKQGLANVVKVGTDVLSAGTYGAAKTGAVSTARTIARGAGTGAGINVAGDVVNQSLDDEEGINLQQLAISGGLGAVLGGVGGGVAARSANKTARAATEADRAITEGVDSSIDDVSRGLDAEDAAREALAPPATPLIDAGEGRIQRRMAEIDEELDGLRKGETDPNAYSTNPEDIRSLEGEKVGRLNKQGTYGETRGATIADSSDTATRARELMRERAALQKEAEGLQSIQKYDTAAAPKLDVEDPQFRAAADSELQAIDNAMPLYDDKQTGKVNALVDYFRTPPKVLEKIGLKNTAKTVEESFEKYRRATLDSNKLIKGWDKRLAGNPDASKRVFNWLDGDKSVRLSSEEQAVANEMKAHLEEWADKLGLDKDQRVTDYITHIFEPAGDQIRKLEKELKVASPKRAAEIEKEIAALQKQDVQDVNLNAILDTKGTGKVYNPFTQRRLGKAGYKEDALAAMEAYLKKSNRQFYMEPALKVTKEASENVDERTARYVLKLNQSLAMKPDKFEQMMNDVIASATGDRLGKQGGTRLMRGWRNTVYRATLGLNIGSALRNLTQGTNTFAELGTRRTLQGYSKLIRTFADAARQKASGKPITAWDELVEHGILGDAFHQQDRSYTALSKGLQKADKGLWAMFDTAERINRGSAYFGAKATALAKGMPEEKAIEYAKGIVGKTQFRFNDVETPLVLRSQALKTIGQFQSFNIKQGEFLGEKVAKAFKGDTVEMYKLARWVAANMAVAYTVGNMLGLKWHDAIPDFGTFRGVRSPLLEVGKNAKNILSGTNEYGQETDRSELVKDAASDVFGLTIPGGTQIKKTKEGLEAVERGGSYTDSDRLRYTVEDTGENRLRAGLFGQYNLDEGQEFFDRGRESFTEKQSSIIGDLPSGEQQAYETLFRNLSEKTDSKLNTANKIRSAIKDKQFQKGKRLAEEHNASIEREIDALEDRVGRLDKDMVDYLRSTYKVNYDYYKRNPKED